MAKSEKDVQFYKSKYNIIKKCLNEKGKRLWAAVEAKNYGYGGVTVLSEATNLGRTTIHKGLKEILSPIDEERIRKVGGGRKKITQIYPNILTDLDRLVDPTSKGDPENPLRWTSKSTRKLSNQLSEKGYKIGHTSTGLLLRQLGYSLQVNKKTLENGSQPDRNKQFELINDSVKKMQSKGFPCLSVDTKKKENIGNYKNNGQEYCAKGKPIEVKAHDFTDKKLGKVVPYGIYDIGQNKGWVSVGISADTAQFAVNTIRTWWYTDGEKNYPNAKLILITADCGGSNGYRVRLWKMELQKLATQIGIVIEVHHFPPGTSKWNKIEHRLFSYISKNWRGKPLIDKETVVNLIGKTKTTTGLTISAVLDKNNYKTGIKVSDKEMETVKLKPYKFHPEWNYRIIP
jgi:hypothetical protein